MRGPLRWLIRTNHKMIKILNPHKSLHAWPNWIVWLDVLSNEYKGIRANAATYFRRGFHYLLNPNPAQANQFILCKFAMRLRYFINVFREEP